MAEAEGAHYRFPPLERRGVIAGVTGTQLTVGAAGCVAALLTLRVLPGAPGAAVAVAILAATVAAACWNVSGRTLGGWVPVVGGWIGRRSAQPRLSDLPGVGTTRNGPARGAPPIALAGVSLAEAPDLRGGSNMGVVCDLKAGTVAAMLVVHGRSFSLLDPGEEQRRLEVWGGVLAGLCREGSPVERIQWVERALPGRRDGLRNYLEGASRSVAAGTPAARESYAELIAGAGPVGQSHDVLVVLAVNQRRCARAGRSFGKGKAAAFGVLQREVRLLQGQLRQAELTVDGVLNASEVAAALRTGFDPALAGQPTKASDGVGPPAGGPWPLALQETWSSLRADGSWHVTYWVAEWPRLDVGPDFLSPLLLAAGGIRAASLVLAPIPPARAAREVEAARTADLADEKLREKAGFLTTARRQRQSEGVLRRESELADGHADFRYSGYVTVSGASEAELSASCAEVEQAARQANLELRRLYGQQMEAFTWTLPLARGLR